MIQHIVEALYFLSAILFIFGLKKMSTPNTAKNGLRLAGLGMLISVLITFLHQELNSNYLLITIAMLLGGGITYFRAYKTPQAQIPQMAALLGGLGGGSAVVISAVAFIKLAPLSDTLKYIALLGALLGCISLSGSLSAYAKYKGLLKKPINLPMHHWLNALILVIAVTFAVAMVLNGNNFDVSYLAIFLALSLILGIFILLPIENDDLIISSSLLGAFSGIAIGLIGFALNKPLIMLIGFVAGATALTLSKQISAARKRPLPSMIFGDEDSATSDVQQSRKNKNIKEININDAASIMALARNVIIIPGYGMAVSQAQQKLGSLSQQLAKNDVKVKFAIHPDAGRMPGHMNMLLNEAGISHELIHDLNEVNDEFSSTDLVLIIGANDVTNPSARSDQSGPLYGMPILNADKAKNVIVIKRGDGKGYSNIENPLYYQSNTGLIYGDADSVLDDLTVHLKSV